MELVAYVAYFLKTVAKKQPHFDQVKADIQRLISESEDRLRNGSFPQEDYDLARFAICAWVDEAILTLHGTRKAGGRENNSSVFTIRRPTLARFSLIA